MKSYLIYLLLLINALGIMSCKSTKPAFDPETSDKEMIIFGTGGGFTGKVIKYIITTDGNMYSYNGTETSKIAKAPKAMTDQVFANYKTLGFSQMTLNDPGNKYTFIEYKKSGDKSKILWGKNPLENKNVETYFAVLMNIVKKLKPTETL